MGAVLGIALLVSLLGHASSREAALDAFRQAWLLCAVATATSARIASRMRPAECCRRPRGQ